MNCITVPVEVVASEPFSRYLLALLCLEKKNPFILGLTLKLVLARLAIVDNIGFIAKARESCNS